MRTDPNLEKIREANLGDIRRGNINPTLAQAKDYLYNILGQHQSVQAEKEMDLFAAQVKQIARRNRRHGKRHQEKAKRQHN